MLTTAFPPIDDLIREAVGAQDETALGRRYIEQDEFAVVEVFLVAYFGLRGVFGAGKRKPAQ